MIKTIVLINDIAITRNFWFHQRRWEIELFLPTNHLRKIEFLIHLIFFINSNLKGMKIFFIPTDLNWGKMLWNLTVTMHNLFIIEFLKSNESLFYMRTQYGAFMFIYVHIWSNMFKYVQICSNIHMFVYVRICSCTLTYMSSELEVT